MAKRGQSGINALIGVDKPLGCSSHDVVARVRRALGERRVGHAGTLDPMASGVMVVGIGQATRLLGRITLDTKSYIAQISFGTETTTDDAEGEVRRSVPADERLKDESFARDVIASWVGDHMQVPPAYSAISVNGVRAYRRARSGDDFELPARAVSVYDAMLLGIESHSDTCIWVVSFTVSKGTYIRALARDIARGIGSAAHLAGLSRTASGGVRLASCLAIDDISPDTVGRCLLDPVQVLGFPACMIDARELEAVRCGRALPARLPADGSSLGEGASVALVHRGSLFAIAHASGGVLAMEQVYPDGIGGVRA